MREYAFLLSTTALSVSFAVAHDEITATLSPAYFLVAKGLQNDPRPFRSAVAFLAVRASYWVGLVLGTALLVANNPSRRRPQLGYPLLFRLTGLPIGAAVLGASLVGPFFRFADLGLHSTAVAYAGQAGAPDFLLVWGIHAGTYVGAFAGGTAAVVIVVRRRNLVAVLRPSTLP